MESAPNDQRPEHILKLSQEQRRRFLNSFDRVFSDIDGVVWCMEYDIPGVADGYSALQGMGKELSFITNNSVRSMEQYERRFQKLGIKVGESELWHPAQSIVEYLRRIKFDGLIYIIASEPFKSVLRKAGFQLLDGPNEFIKENFGSLAKHIFDREPVRAVILDVDFNLTSPKVLRAHIYLRHPDCLLIHGATDTMLPVGNDLRIIGPGPFQKILVEATGKPGATLGKPGKELGEILLQHYNIRDPKRVLMIGDMLEQDVQFGRQCGFQTLLVLSGGCTLSELRAESSPERLPDYYADSVADLAKLVNDVAKAHV
ncbi:pyridoxal phosphate phosphatase [Scaptodrosophila lebanonensis]|uniref:Pyridoxal phosphate phosphatase n=1 Tax=Drosophila lebanonensis TaxID=7225 RepID=A0A6J2UIQ7_DROLE|nr:pyridoxal phosphate phosphatase [Scaptodrosophila lebanonensis]